MAHELLDGGEIRAGIQEFTPEGASQFVWREGCHASLLTAPLDSSIQA